MSFNPVLYIIDVCGRIAGPGFVLGLDLLHALLAIGDRMRTAII